MTPEEYADLPYLTTVKNDMAGDTHCFFAENPELPGCVAQGFTILEAIDNLKEARIAWIDLMLTCERPIPLPKPREPFAEGQQVGELFLIFRGDIRGLIEVTQ